MMSNLGFIETTNLMFVFLIHCMFSITNSKEVCGVAQIFISTNTSNLALSWKFNCDEHPDMLTLFEKTRGSGVKVIKKVRVKKNQLSGTVDTGYSWDYGVFPENWYPNSTKSENNTFVCYPFYLVLFKKKVRQASQCFRIYPNWMSGFPSIRLGKFYLPGTFRSGAIERYQKYNFWGQLVFGIRYFDINIGMNRNTSFSKYPKKLPPYSLLKELGYIKMFLQRAQKEVVVLDFRGFFSFYTKSDHDILVDTLKVFFKNKMALVNISNHKDGPTLSALWQKNYQIIINYRHPETVKRYPFLWNEIFVNNCKNVNTENLSECIRNIAQTRRAKITKKMFSITIKMKETVYDDFFYNPSPPFLKNIKNGINIIAVEYFESSKIIDDAFVVNTRKLTGRINSQLL